MRPSKIGVLCGLGVIAATSCGDEQSARTGVATQAEPVSAPGVLASVVGKGAGVFVSGPFAGDVAGLKLRAQVLSDGTMSGEFTFFQRSREQGDGDDDDRVASRLRGTVDCLSVTDHTAIATGTITAGFDLQGVPPVGQRMSFTVTEDDPDSFGFDISFLSGRAIAPCTSTPLDTIPLTRGDFDIRGSTPVDGGTDGATDGGAADGGGLCSPPGIGANGCGGTTPICTSSGTCVQCLSHSDCPSGLCEVSGFCICTANTLVDGGPGCPDGLTCDAVTNLCL